jgi:hypothetical protein
MKCTSYSTLQYGLPSMGSFLQKISNKGPELGYPHPILLGKNLMNLASINFIVKIKKTFQRTWTGSH